MAKDNVTLSLRGERVPLQEFATAMVHFRAFIEALSAEVASGTKIEWVIDDLGISSAIATVRGEANDVPAVERVIEAYGECGRRLQRGESLPYSPPIAAEAQHLLALVNGNVNAIEFETPDGNWVVRAPPDRTADLPFAGLPPVPAEAYGAVEGRIQTVSNRRGLRFTLYDTLQDRAISCYLDEDRAELVRGVWGRRAIVEGWITRDPYTGRPLSVRRITAITAVPDREPGTYRDARNVLPLARGGLLPEDAIRRVRDG